MRTSRRRRTSRGPARRRRLTSRGARRHVSRNPIPPAPTYTNQRAWRHWASVTFARGTSIITREPLLGFILTPGQAYVATTVTIPAGTKGVVREIRLGNAPEEFNVTLDFLPSWSVSPGSWTAIYASQIEETLEPLDDNWGPAPRPLGRWQLPASQRSWLKPNGREWTLTSRSMPLRIVGPATVKGVSCGTCRAPILLDPESDKHFACAHGHAVSTNDVYRAQYAVASRERWPE